MTPDTLKTIAKRWIVGIWDHADFQLMDELAADDYAFEAGIGGCGARAQNERRAIGSPCTARRPGRRAGRSQLSTARGRCPL